MTSRFLDPKEDRVDWTDAEWDRFQEYSLEEEEDIDIGVCWCGHYGEAGKVHVRMIDGHMEECGEYL